MADTREELKLKLSACFNSCCNWAEYGNHKVTTEQRKEFIEEASKLFDSPTIDPDWLTRRLLKTEGKFASQQERSIAILGGS